MRLAISNIAWDPQREREFLPIVIKHGFGLEISPSTTFSSMDKEAALKKSRNLDEQGIKIVAFQSLLFGRNELKLFEGASPRNKMIDYLSKLISIAGSISVEALVFGSPRNRIVGNIPIAEKTRIENEFFNQIAKLAKINNVKFCLEANPSHYGSDYLLTNQETIELLKRLDHKEVRLNLDVGAIKLNNEPIVETFANSVPFAGHVHLSEPDLAPLELDGSLHMQLAEKLREQAYDGYISIEMRKSPSLEPKKIDEILSFVKHIYG